MKKIYLLVLFCLVGHFSVAQSKVLKPTRIGIINSIQGLRDSLENGIFERIIEQAEIEKANTFNSKNTYTPYIEIHKLFYRFCGFDRQVQVTPDSSYFYVVGKVFVSERYRELDYRSVHRNRSTFEDDKDGFYYYCKLYYHEQLKDFRVVIYPGMVQNVCAPYMHFNKRTCMEHALVDYRKGNLPVIATEHNSVHENSIRAIVEIPDALNIDFIVDNSKNKTWRVDDTKEFVSLTKEKYKDKPYNTNFRLWDEPGNWNYWSGGGFDWVNTTILNLFFLKNNTLRVSLNLSKQMKIFRINMEGNKPKSITLVSSKNTNNEDFSYRARYDLNYKSFASITQLPSDVFIQSEDKGLVNIITSAYPDDHYMAGKNRVYRRLLFITTGNPVLDSCIGSNNFEARLKQMTNQFNVTIDNQARVLQKLREEKKELDLKLDSVMATQANESSKKESVRKDIAEANDNFQRVKAPFQHTGLNAYLDQLYKGEEIDLTRLTKMYNVMLELTSLKDDAASSTASRKGILGQVKAKLAEYESLRIKSVPELVAVYKLDVDSSMFKDQYQDGDLVGELLIRISSSGNQDTISKQIFIESLDKILTNKNDVKTLNDHIEQAKTKVLDLYSMKAERMNTIRGLDKAIDDIVVLKTSIEQTVAHVSADQKSSQNGLDSLKKGDIQLEVARKFQNTFMPDHPSMTKYFIYIDPALAAEVVKKIDNNAVLEIKGFGKIFNVNVRDKIRLVSQLFDKAIYVRGGLPVRTVDFIDESKTQNSELSEYLKGQIMEVYNPYDINRRMIRQKYKAELTKLELHQKGGWQSSYHKAISETLKKQHFVIVNHIDPATNKITGEIPSTSAYKAASNVNTIWTVMSGGRQYHWLQISNELFESLRYMNWYFYKYDKNPNKVM